MQVVKTVVIRKTVTSADEKADEEECTTGPETDEGGVEIIKKVITTKTVTLSGDQKDEGESTDVIETGKTDVQVIRKVISKQLLTSVEDLGIEGESTEVIETDDGDIQVIERVITEKILTSGDEEFVDGETLRVTDTDDGEVQVIKKVITRKVVTSADDETGEDESTEVTETDDGDIKIIKKIITKKIITSEDSDDVDKTKYTEEGKEESEIESGSEVITKVTKIITKTVTSTEEEERHSSEEQITKDATEIVETVSSTTREKIVEHDKTKETMLDLTSEKEFASSEDGISKSSKISTERALKQVSLSPSESKTTETSFISSTEEKVHSKSSISEDSSEIKKTVTEMKTTKVSLLDDMEEEQSSEHDECKASEQTTPKTDSIGSEARIRTRITSQSEITEDTETIEKSETKTEDISTKSVTTTIVKQYDDGDQSSAAQDTGAETGGTQSPSSEMPTSGVQIRTITKISTSESTESKDFKEEVISTEGKSVRTVTTTSVSEPLSEEKDESTKQKFTSDSEASEGSPTRRKSKKREPRVIKKKIIVYHTGPESSAEEFLTEDKIREAIIGAGGKASSKSVTRIVSSGTTEDLESFAGQDDVIEVKSISESSTTSERYEATSTESSTKHESAFERVEQVETDPFSLITKPLEETFKKRTLEETQEEKTSEIKYTESKTTTEFSTEKTKEVVEEKDMDTSQKSFKDSKVATDAKKLVMERQKEEKSASQSSVPQESTAREPSDTSVRTERTGEALTDADLEGISQSEESTATGSKSFSLDEWDKPMGLPSPPEPLEIDDNIASLAKQNTTTSSKQDGNYSQTKREKSASEKEGASPTKSEADEKADKEYESSTEKDYRQSDNKEAEKSTEPVYIDLTYVPHFGDPHYCNADFFRRIRSRYYVFSGSKPSKEVFNALLEAKQEWKDKDAKVTIIPTYETDTLGYWMAVNQEALIANNIDVAPSASRCTINLQDHETSCSAYRLEL